MLLRSRTVCGETRLSTCGSVLFGAHYVEIKTRKNGAVQTRLQGQNICDPHVEDFPRELLEAGNSNEHKPMD